MKGAKPGTGASTQHGLNKQNERGSGPKNQPFADRGDMTQGSKWKSRVNPNPPNVDNARNNKPKVPVAPKIDSTEKRVIMSGASANKHTSTYTAPRSSGGGGGVTDVGYTKLGKV